MRRLIVVIVLLLCSSALAHAARKRVAVVAVEGDGSAKIHAALVKLIDKSHTVISVKDWNRTAKALSATKPTATNIKTVSRKLRVDAVVQATSTKRRGGFQVRIRLRSGSTGLTVEDIVATTQGTEFDKTSRRDIKHEIVDVIATLDDDDDMARAKPRKRR